MKIAIAQINCIVGDLAGNAQKIVAYATSAKEQGATLVVTPELSLCGYSPEDLLLRPDFLRACEDTLATLAQQLPDITVIVGHPHQVGEQCFNAASVLEGGSIVATYHKQSLPNYGVFDEKRYFASGSEALVFNHGGVKVGVLICADVWEPKPALLAKMAGAELLIAMNGSPYHMKKQSTRFEVLKQRAQENNLPVVYVNMVGGQDELVFDGASFVLNAQGEVVAELDAFESQLEVIEFDHAQPIYGEITPPGSSRCRRAGRAR